MVVRLGRFLQMLGMIILPVGLMFGTVGNKIRVEVLLLGIGGALFIIGWLMSRKPDD